MTEVKCCRLERRALSWQVDRREETVLGFNGSKRISDDKKKMNFTSLQASQAVCQQQFGANLVSIDTPEEAEKLCDIVSDRYCVLCCCFYRFQ